MSLHHTMGWRRPNQRLPSVEQPSATLIDKRWTAEEDEILRRTYTNEATSSAALPSRSKGAIRVRAYKLGLNVARRLPWATKEFDLIRKLYPERSKLNPGNFHTIFPNRTWGQIAHAAERMGVTRTVRKTLEDAKHPDPVLQQIRERARDMGIGIVELCSLLGMDRQTFSPGKARVNTNWAMVAKAVDELGGRLAIVWVEDEPEDVNATPVALVKNA